MLTDYYLKIMCNFNIFFVIHKHLTVHIKDLTEIVSYLSNLFSSLNVNVLGDRGADPGGEVAGGGA